MTITPAIDPTVFLRLMALPPEPRRDLLELVGATPLPSERLRDLVEMAVQGLRTEAAPRH